MKETGLHDPVEAVYDGRNNHKYRHVSARGRIKYCNHWYKVYKCPVCGQTFSHKRRPIICKGAIPPLPRSTLRPPPV